MKLAALLLLCVFGIAHADERSMKGWELYAWPCTDKASTAGVCFALLVGTNRNKTVDEIRQAPLGLAALEQRLGTLATGEDVMWLVPDATFVAPRDEDPATRRVRAACAKRGLRLAR